MQAGMNDMVTADLYAEFMEYAPVLSEILHNAERIVMVTL